MTDDDELLLYVNWPFECLSSVKCFHVFGQSFKKLNFYFDAVVLTCNKKVHREVLGALSPVFPVVTSCKTPFNTTARISASYDVGVEHSTPTESFRSAAFF